MKEKNSLFLILLGVAAGVTSIFIPGTLFIFLCIFIISVLIKSFAKEEDKSFILSIFLIGMGVRVLLALILYFLSIYLHIGYEYCDGRACDPLIVDRYALGVIGDSAFTSLRGWWLAQVWHGNIERSWFRLEDMVYAPRDHHFRIYAAFYYLFGFSQFAAKLINSLFSVGAAVLIYYIAKDIFEQRVAKLAAILAAFFPTIVLWSVTHLKEPINSFFICLTIFSIHRLIFLKKKSYLLLLIISFANIFVRYSLGIFTLCFALLSLIIGLSRNKYFRLAIVLLICSVMMTSLGREKVKSAETKLISEINGLIYAQRGVVSAGGAVYQIYPEDFEGLSSIKQLFSLDFMAAAAKGVIFFLLTPFPWQISSKLQLLSYPQVILWYLLFAFALVGIIFSLRYYFKESCLILVFLFFSVLLSSLVSGNIGSAMRHRDITTPLILLFSAAGLVSHFSSRKENEYCFD
ncbi:ArnT family glycosyltransferase [Candidatus Omnitrophota bacterium]